MNRVLVARLDSMGDVLVSGPAVRAVAARSEVVLLCGPRGEEAARMLPGVSEVIVWDCPWISNPPGDPSPAHMSAVVEQIRAAEVTEAVVLTSFHQSPLPLALLLRLAGITRITAASVDYAGALLDVRVRPGEDFAEDLPEPERALEIVGAAGFERPLDSRLAVTGVPDTAWLTERSPYTVLHPGAAVPARQWPIELYACLAAALALAGQHVVVTGSESERELASVISNAVPSVLDLTGRCSLRELAGALRGADAVVCGNTGPAHLAAAVGTPVVSLFAPVVPASKWAPYGVPHRLLGDQSAPCKDSRARECPVPGHPCLASVRPDDVVAAVRSLAPRSAPRTGPLTEEIPA